MKRFVAALVLAFSIALGCTLLDQPTSYFDPDGGLVTMAIVPGYAPIAGVRNLVLTRSAVFIATPTNVYRIDKSGGDLQSIDTSSAGDFSSIGSDATSRVAWCSQANGVTIWDDTAGSIIGHATQPNRACETVAISPDTLAYTTSDLDTDAGTQPRRLVIALSDGGGGDYTLLDGSAFAPVAFTESDTYFVSERNVLARAILPSDDPSGVLVGAPLCFVGAGISPADEIIGSGDAGLVFYLNENEARFAGVSSPCCGAGDASCTISVMRSASIAVPVARTAVRGTDLFHVGSQNGATDIVRDSLVGGDADQTIVRTGLGNALDLAVDDANIFFLVGDKLQRVPE